MRDPQTDIDPLDTLLDSSAPPRSQAPQLGAELSLMASRSRVASRRGTRGGARRAVIVGGAFVLAAGGATAAAASGAWQPWAEDPDAIYSYRLPSGAWCEERVGAVQALERRQDVIEAAEDILRHGDVFARADIEGALADLRRDENWLMGDGVNPTPAGYGTPYYDADEEYQSAITLAVGEVVRSDLAARVPDFEEANFSWQGETHCTEPAWWW